MAQRDLRLMDLGEQPMGKTYWKLKQTVKTCSILTATMLHPKKFKESLGITDLSAGENVMSLWLKKGKTATSSLEILNQM